MSKYWNISAPITVHLEITEICNERCRHCYNFFRPRDVLGKTISFEDLDNIIKELIKNKVMHIIVTGGEPLLALDKTIHLIKKAKENDMTVSLNSNLVAANPDNMKKLKDAGLDHILTTMHSWKEEVHDYIASTPGALKLIVNGIKTAQNAGIRVTVNTILSDYNKDDIYDTGKFVKSIGVSKFLANRTIPSPTNVESLKKEFRVEIDTAKKMFDDLLRLQNELEMEVGTCRTVPQCLFDDLDKYDCFLARGCAAGKRHLAISVEGDCRACVHESRTYGNVHKIGLKKVWKNMAEWRSLKYIPEDCQECHLFDVCDGGCRIVALAYTGSMDGFDNLRKGANHLPQYEGGIKPEHIDAAKNGIFAIHPNLSFRKENGFSIVRTCGARIDFIDKPLFDILLDHHKINSQIRLKDIGKDNIKKFAYYIKRGILIPYKTVPK